MTRKRVVVKFPGAASPSPGYAYYTTAKSVKVGGIELFGVKTTVSEHPELKRAVAGRAFLTLMDTTWEGSTMTVRRLP